MNTVFTALSGFDAIIEIVASLMHNVYVHHA